MEEKTFDRIVDLAEIISKKLKQDGNPHQSIVITQNKVTLVSEDRGQPLNIPTGSIKR